MHEAYSKPMLIVRPQRHWECKTCHGDAHIALKTEWTCIFVILFVCFSEKSMHLADQNMASYDLHICLLGNSMLAVFKQFHCIASIEPAPTIDGSTCAFYWFFCQLILKLQTSADTKLRCFALFCSNTTKPQRKWAELLSSSCLRNNESCAMHEALPKLQ